MDRPRCVTCGRYFKHEAGVAWRMVYSGGPLPEPDHEAYRCRPCVEKVGPFDPQPGIRPEFSCGIVKEIGHVESWEGRQ